MRKLGEFASVRAGDKGNTCILALVPFDLSNFGQIAKVLSAEKVAEHFGNIAQNVSIQKLDYLGAFTIVIRNQLDGGVTRSRRLDRHGKTLGSHLLEMDIDI
jgi:hypothetical protein